MNKNLLSLLIILKAASLMQKESLQVQSIQVDYLLVKVLYKHGIIQNFIKQNNSCRSTILIFLRYFFNVAAFQFFKILSKPSLVLHLKFRDLNLLHDKKHTLFLQTSKGILSNFECKVKKIGGIALFKC